MSYILANALGRLVTNGPQGHSCEIIVKVAHEFPKKTCPNILLHFHTIIFANLSGTHLLQLHYWSSYWGRKNYVCIGISMNFVLHGFFGHFVMWVTLCLSILCCLCFSLILSGRMQMKSFVVRPCSPPWVNAAVSQSPGWPGGSRCPLATSDEELQWSGE